MNNNNKKLLETKVKEIEMYCEFVAREAISVEAEVYRKKITKLQAEVTCLKLALNVAL